MSRAWSGEKKAGEPVNLVLMPVIRPLAIILQRICQLHVNKVIRRGEIYSSFTCQQSAGLTNQIMIPESVYKLRAALLFLFSRQRSQIFFFARFHLEACSQGMLIETKSVIRTEKAAIVTLANSVQSFSDLRSRANLGCSSMFTCDSKPTWKETNKQ